MHGGRAFGDRDLKSLRTGTEIVCEKACDADLMRMQGACRPGRQREIGERRAATRQREQTQIGRCAGERVIGRFGERLLLEWSLDDSANAARLPPLLLQPLVENAVKHGVEPSGEATQVRVSTQRRCSTVVIKVSNTVTKHAELPGPGHGMALVNVRERLILLHDVQGRFQYGLKNGVFQVRIEVPL